MSKFKQFAGTFLWFFLAPFVSGTILYLVLYGTAVENSPFSASYGLEGISFGGVAAVGVLAIVCSSYAFLATFVMHCIQPTRWWSQCIAYVAVLIMALGISCVLGGISWAFLDMQAGFFPRDSRLWSNPLSAAQTALDLGPQMFFNSLPLAFVYFTFGYGLIAYRFSKMGLRPEMQNNSRQFQLEPEH